MESMPETMDPPVYDGLARHVQHGIGPIVDVGCGNGQLASIIKRLFPRRPIFGVENNPELSQQARNHCDDVFVIDIERHPPPLPPASVEVLIYADVLQHLQDPEVALRRDRQLLKPSGMILASLPNIQHHSIIRGLLAGEFQYQRSGLLDRSHKRFFAWSSIFKMFLDAGYRPEILEDVTVSPTDNWVEHLDPVLAQLKLHPSRTRRYLNAYQFLIRGTPLPELHEIKHSPVSIVACISDRPIADNNLLASADLQQGTHHEILAAEGFSDAAGGLNHGIERAKHDWIICAHQDVYLPKNWISCFLNAVAAAQDRFGPLGVVGVYGVQRTPEGYQRVGQVVDRDRILWEKPPLPSLAESLDELLIALPRGSPLRFDRSLGFHGYGTDIVLAAQQIGRPAVVVEAPCFHNSRSVGLPKAFYQSMQALGVKWQNRLPLVTPCVQIHSSDRIMQW